MCMSSAHVFVMCPEYVAVGTRVFLIGAWRLSLCERVCCGP